MKLQLSAALGLAAAAALVLAAGPGAAQGTFNPNGRRPAPLPPAGFGPPAGYGAPEPSDGYGGGSVYRRPAGGIEQPKQPKPYEPPNLGPSSYSAPKPSPQGAKPCELSVYVNACQHHH